MKLAAIQMNSGSVIYENLAVVREYIAEAAFSGADLVVLPENFSLMAKTHTQRLRAAEAAEDIQRFLSGQASQHQLILVGGSVPLLATENRVTNTCLVYGPDGSCVGRYDKIHLFDVSLENGEAYFESQYVASGLNPVTIDILSTCIGLTICYDIRFPELYRNLVLQGAEILTVPSAFTIPTGEAHWETLLRARAIENLSWVVGAAQTGDHPGRSTWGHSAIVSPWGEVVAEKASGVGFIIVDADLVKLRDLRSQFPSLNHLRLHKNIT
jgi:predicted amidohydrolase